MRYFVLTNKAFKIFETEGATQTTLDIPISAISIVFQNPGKDVHTEAVGSSVGLMFAIRLFDNGVFTLLVRCKNEEEKLKWLEALEDAVKNSKGCQIV